MKYNLGVLNDKEFEDLCKDILDIALKVDLQIFKEGKDGGIDLCYSGEVENQIVVQVKHYERSSFSHLIAKLEKERDDSVAKMNPIPRKYILATSLPLSPDQGKKIKAAMLPYIRATNDIYGRRRIESMLSRSDEVLQRHFKLWLTSSSVLKKMLHHNAYLNAEFFTGEILKLSKLFVMSSNFSDAQHKLEENRFLVISGEPGVGKTTLAYMLVYERLAAGYELVYCDGRIAEIEGMLSQEPNKKQIFLMDDFLGANLYDINTLQNPENKIINFVSKIQHSKNKLLIMTTRTTILNEANYRFEKLHNSRITGKSKYELRLKDYSLVDKARILYNHLYFGDLGEEFRDEFFRKETYRRILEHTNYYPRIIQFLTDENHYPSVPGQSVEDFIFENLENPELIWAYEYDRQLGDEERFLIMALFTLGGIRIEEQVLENAFESRYAFEIKTNNIKRKPRAFKDAIKKLLDGFIRAFQDAKTGTNSYSFLNPSIIDFLLVHLDGDNDEKLRILRSVSYIEQLSKYFGSVKGPKVVIGDRLADDVFPDLLIIAPTLRSVDSRVCVSLEFLYLSMNSFGRQVLNRQREVVFLLDDILAHPENIDAWKVSMVMMNIYTDSMELLMAEINARWNRLLGLMIRYAKDEDDLKYFVELFRHYGHDFDEYFEDEGNRYDLQCALHLIFEGMLTDMDFSYETIIDNYNYRSEKYAIERVEEEAWEKYVQFVADIGLDGDYFDRMDHEYEIDAAQTVSYALDSLRVDHDDDYHRGKLSSQPTREDPWEEINRLFQKD
ncbi:restriction endonuclease [Pedobacter agri]|uniref:nSTAND3 domain-containing NTPase n=1 Tax=Pedobacter agri TaxID=454586 RepID=UPI0027835896|nr:restriction endonuclease [Pedobacter agri]MDQ1138629.1 ABC-type oligopeptide transport system ATPase subunit [Pedobacter agri]